VVCLSVSDVFRGQLPAVRRRYDDVSAVPRGSVSALTPHSAVRSIATCGMAWSVCLSVTCFAGSYQPSDGGTTRCQPCPVGQYQPSPHADRCEQCPDGQTTPDEASTSQEDCTSNYLEAIKSGASSTRCQPSM